MVPGGEVSKLEIAGRTDPGRYGMVELVGGRCAEASEFGIVGRNGDTENDVVEIGVEPCGRACRLALKALRHKHLDSQCLVGLKRDQLIQLNGLKHLVQESEA